MHNFKNLAVWNKSRELVKEIYFLTADFPDDERYGLSSQIKRCVISIPSNIAEGSGRSSDLDFIRFLKISLGSAYELETQIILTLDLQIINEFQFDSISKNISEIQKMLHGLIKSLQTDKRLAS